MQDAVGYLWVLPPVLLALALWFGPTPIPVRGVIRSTLGPVAVRRWYPSATIGLCAGLLGASVVAPTPITALLSLLLLLAVIDWQWRWLPIEWTLAVIALALVHGLQTGTFPMVVLQIIIPGLSLFVLRFVVSRVSGKEVLGLGDVWLVAGLGGFLSPFQSFLLIGLAALSGLFELGTRMFLGRLDARKPGVSYGTHLCIVFVLLLSFWRIV